MITRFLDHLLDNEKFQQFCGMFIGLTWVSIIFGSYIFLGEKGLLFAACATLTLAYFVLEFALFTLKKTNDNNKDVIEIWKQINEIETGGSNEAKSEDSRSTVD